MMRFEVGNGETLEKVRKLWEGLNNHHLERSPYFKAHYESFSFDVRKESLLRKERNGAKLRVEVVADDVLMQNVAYCICSMDEDKVGEIESIYVAKSCRHLGLGGQLMRHALEWMDALGAEKKTVAVAYGNELAFGFYEHFGFYPRMTLLQQK